MRCRKPNLARAVDPAWVVVWPAGFRWRALLFAATATGLVACAAREGVPDRSSARHPSLDAPHAPSGVSNAPAAASSIRIIAFNDFHGNLEPLSSAGRPMGGAEAFAAYVRQLQNGYEGRALLVHAGDQVGASPPASGLLQDEPSIALLNLLANEHCALPSKDDPRCNVVGTLGNHEFDEGVPELLRLLRGGNSSKGPFLQTPYTGARFPYVSANVMEHATNKPLLPTYVVRTVGGVQVGVIGAVLQGAKRLLNPASPGLAGLDFVDVPTAVNRAADDLVARGVHVIVLTIHEGLEQDYYPGPTQRGLSAEGALTSIASQLHDEIDVIVSGHTHAFTNAYLPKASGNELLVVQSLSAGRAVAAVDLEIHPHTNHVSSKVAQVYETFGDVAPGTIPQPDVAALVHAASNHVAPQTERIVGRVNVPLPREFNEAGESALGNIIADAQRDAAKADFALTNPGGIRTGIPVGPVTWGQLFAVQPFGNQLVVVILTGRQLAAVLERQWQDGHEPRFLQISGFSYEWDATAARGQRVVTVATPNGTPLAAERTYRVVVNSYMASGGDGFGLEAVANTPLAQTDLDAIVSYFQAHPRGLEAPVLGRVIKRR